MNQTKRIEEMSRDAISDVKKSKTALYWESRQGIKGEIVNMRAVLK